MAANANVRSANEDFMFSAEQTSAEAPGSGHFAYGVLIVLKKCTIRARRGQRQRARPYGQLLILRALSSPSDCSSGGTLACSISNWGLETHDKTNQKPVMTPCLSCTGPVVQSEGIHCGGGKQITGTSRWLPSTQSTRNNIQKA